MSLHGVLIGGIYAEFRAYYTEPDKRLVSRGSWYREGYDKYPTLTLEESECLKDNEATIHALSNFTIDILYKNNAKICTYRHELYDERVKFINKKMNKSVINLSSLFCFSVSLLA